MVLMVSADEEDVTGFLGESVLLRCTCSDRNLDKDFKWQREDRDEAVFIYNRTASYFTESYKGRAEIFLAKNSSNCSVLLTKITADDQGRYSCRFSTNIKYKRFFVNLNVTARYIVHPINGPITLSGGVKVYECDVEGHDQLAEIRWSLDGEPLKNSSTTNISTTYTLDAGVYHFTSKLMTELSWTSQPKCVAIGISTNSTPVIGEPPKHPDRRFRIRFKIISIALVLGFILFLCIIGKFCGRITEDKRSDNI